MNTNENLTMAYRRALDAEQRWVEALENEYGKQATEYRYDATKNAGTPRLKQLREESRQLTQALLDRIHQK